MQIKPRMFYKMSLFDYHFVLGAGWYSKTFLADLLPPRGCPAKALFNHKTQGALDLFDRKMEKFNFGGAFHAYFLEPEIYKQEVEVKPDVKGKGSRGILNEWKERMREEQKTPISEDQHQKILAYNRVLHSGNFETARQIIESENRFTETSGFWIDNRTQIPLKIRPDIILKNGEMWDLKNHSAPSAFEKTAMDLMYDMQAAMCIEGMRAITGQKVNHFGFIVFHGNEEPYEIELREATEEFIESGRDRLNKALNILAECKEKDEWPGRFPDRAMALSVPLWRVRQVINQGMEELYS